MNLETIEQEELTEYCSIIMTVEEFYEFRESLARKLTERNNRRISDSDVMAALYLLKADEQNMEGFLDVWDLDITLDEAWGVLQEFDFDGLNQCIEIEYESLPKELFWQKKGEIKLSGSVWRIHKYDADPFPSIPHAHHVEENYKLDLSNGNCYKKRKWVCRVSKKELLKIREKAKKVYKGWLPDLQLE